MDIINLLKFILSISVFYSLFESIKARENANFIKEFRYLLWAILMLLSLKS